MSRMILCSECQKEIRREEDRRELEPGIDGPCAECQAKLRLEKNVPVLWRRSRPAEVETQSFRSRGQ